MPILNRESFNSEEDRLTVNSLFLECISDFSHFISIKISRIKYLHNIMVIIY